MITKACFRVCNVEVAPEIIAAHAQVLKTNHQAVYTYTKTEVKKFTLTKGLFSAEINDPFAGRVPNELVMGIVSGAASHGAFDKNPFYFGHCNVSRVQVTADGVDLGEGPIETNYDSHTVTSSYLEAYRSLIGVTGSEDEMPFTRQEFLEGGSVFYRFVTAQENSRLNSDDGGVTPLKRSGNVRVNLRFSKELQEPMTVIMYAKFPGCLKIDKNRAVTEI